VEVRKAIITAAGKSQRTIPLQTLIDSDGLSKTALRIIIEEIRSAGIEDICVIIYPGDQEAYSRAAGQGSRLQFIEQKEPLGYGHAVYCAREFAGNDPFLLLVGDHLYVAGGQKRAAQQLVEIATAEDCAVSAVQATPESKLPYYGTVGGHLVAGRKGIYEITEVLEKPTPTVAEQRLIVPGLRAGYYLCFFGMHVLTPAAMRLLEIEISEHGLGPVHLSAALSKLSKRERYLACEVDAYRYDIGLKYGLLTAQLALAFEGKDRDEVLSGLVELLARRQKK
jgi:UTP--glucose-1-phosphate uridylyltransferase